MLAFVYNSLSALFYWNQLQMLCEGRLYPFPSASLCQQHNTKNIIVLQEIMVEVMNMGEERQQNDTNISDGTRNETMRLC
jgi:hypothetical protein